MRYSLVEAVGRTVSELPPGAVDALAGALEAGRSRAAVARAVPSARYRRCVEALLEAWSAEPVEPAALALALRCAAERQAEASRERLSIVWTGPETDEVPVRRTDQALLELIDAARRRLTVVSYAAYRVPNLARALVAAAERGVRVLLVLESASAGGPGPAGALGREVLRRAELYAWPEHRRSTTRDGHRGALHAKCAVADGERLLVSSANLTEFALSINMELGLLVRYGPVPARVQAHLDALIADGVLEPATAPGAVATAAAAPGLELMDGRVRPLVMEALDLGIPPPEVGYELDDPGTHGWQVELAWPDQRVAVVVDSDDERDSWLGGQGWRFQRWDSWRADELARAVLEEG